MMAPTKVVVWVGGDFGKYLGQKVDPHECNQCLTDGDPKPLPPVRTLGEGYHLQEGPHHIHPAGTLISDIQLSTVRNSVLFKTHPVCGIFCYRNLNTLRGNPLNPSQLP